MRAYATAWKALCLLFAVFFVVGILASPSFAQRRATGDQGNAGNPRVLPPGSVPYGKTYGQWSAVWWQWAYSLPVTGHPLFDETGATCGAGQGGPVWFLGGVFNVSGTAVRNLCVVPAGKALFFPLLNLEFDNYWPPNDPPLSEGELRAMAADLTSMIYDLVCEVDGAPLQNLGTAYRTISPVFDVVMPADNIPEFFGFPTPPGTYTGLVGDGFYVMLAPLSAGEHKIHLAGKLGPPGEEPWFALDVVYNLTVAPASAGATADEDPALATSSHEQEKASWGRVKSIYR